MKITGLIIAATSILIASACSPERDEMADPAADEGITAEAADDAAEKAVSTETDAGNNGTDAFPTEPLIDPNTASADAIARVAGIGAELAQQIVAGRPYATPSQLHAVIGDAVEEDALETIYRHLFVKVDLNQGSTDDYELIPSTLSPSHLAHEFEEYRPYDSVEQFGQEMRKYVSDAEVAYLKRYVTVNPD